MHGYAQVYNSGASLLEAVDSVDLPQYDGWDMYPVTHRRNAHQRYLELELEEFGTEAAAISGRTSPGSQAQGRKGDPQGRAGGARRSCASSLTIRA